jgi:hypothetical protein
MPLRGIRTHNLSRRATAELSLRPCGHWEVVTCRNIKFCICIWSCLGKSRDFIITICHKFFLSLLVPTQQSNSTKQGLTADIHSYSRNQNFQFLQNQKSNTTFTSLNYYPNHQYLQQMSSDTKIKPAECFIMQKTGMAMLTKIHIF